jgi:hypothetical protein
MSVAYAGTPTWSILLRMTRAHYSNRTGEMSDEPNLVAGGSLMVGASLPQRLGPTGLINTTVRLIAVDGARRARRVDFGHIMIVTTVP